MNQKQTKKTHIKEKKLNFVLIQNDKILEIFFCCLQAKLQLLQEYKALFEKLFFSRRSKKACFFQIERLPKKFCKSRKKPLLRPTH